MFQVVMELGKGPQPNDSERRFQSKSPTPSPAEFYLSVPRSGTRRHSTWADS